METRLRWGTTSGSRPNEGIPKSASASGEIAFGDSIHARIDDGGALYLSAYAIDETGHRVETPELKIPFRWIREAGSKVFGTTPDAAIPDATGATLSTALDVATVGSIDVIEVEVDIHHPRRGDLEIDLVAPSGKRVRLKNASADEEDDVRGTFGDGLPSVDPLESLAGERVDGRWRFDIRDLRLGSAGSIHEVALVVTLKPPVPTNELALPNIVAEPPADLDIKFDGTKRLLRFSSLIRNEGPGPFEMRGVLDRTTGATRAYQRIFAKVRDGRGVFTGWALVREKLIGDFVFAGHEQHDHWHFDAFQAYRLLDESFAPAPRAVQSDKVTRCVTDSFRFDATLEGSPALPNYACRQETQGMDVGWGDIYGRTLEGQSIDVTATPDGVYYLVDEVNDRADEAGDLLDNTAALRIAISGATVRVLEKLDGRELAARRAQLTATTR